MPEHDHFTTVIKPDNSTMTKCDLCGAAIADRDRHHDWHGEQVGDLPSHG